MKIKNDLIAGLAIAIIALPLSMGIATASGVSPIAGIIPAIVGGLVIPLIKTLIGGSNLTINGPAAGLIPIILECLNGFREIDSPANAFSHMLGVCVLAGGMVLLFGILGLGKVAKYFSPATVYGLKAVIGITLITKQIFSLVGSSVSAEFSNLDQLYSSADTTTAIIGSICLILFIILSRSELSILKILPSSLLVIAIGIGLGQLYATDTKLVSLPSSLTDAIIMPNFSLIWSGHELISIAFFAGVIFIESMATCTGIAKQDKEQRSVNFNRDLIANGIGVMISCSIGGLPMIFEMVRSSENVLKGAKSIKANFFHAIILLVIVLFLVRVINMIPSTTLAAILVFVGYNMVSIKKMKEVYSWGNDKVFVYLSVILFSFMIDLAVGIIAGVIVDMLFQMYRCYERSNRQLFFNDFFWIRTSVSDCATIVQSPFLTGFNICSFANAKMIDLRNVMYIDQMASDQIQEIAKSGISVNGYEHLQWVGDSNHSSMVSKLINRSKEISRFAKMSENKYYDFPKRFSKGVSYPVFRDYVTREKNIFKCYIEKVRIKISDFEYELKSFLSTTTYHNTKVEIRGFGQIPNFLLRIETIYDKRFSRLEDIDFDDDTDVFSKKYHLTGENQSDIKKLFVQEVREWVLINDILIMNSIDNNILIIFNGLKQPERYEKLLNSCKRLVDSMRK